MHASPGHAETMSRTGNAVPIAVRGIRRWARHASPLRQLLDSNPIGSYPSNNLSATIAVKRAARYQRDWKKRLRASFLLGVR